MLPNAVRTLKAEHDLLLASELNALRDKHDLLRASELNALRVKHDLLLQARNAKHDALRIEFATNRDKLQEQVNN